MGWSIPTYYGTRATGKPSNYRVAMFELIRAINERRSAQGLPLSATWLKSDGTLVASPSMDDLEDSPAYGHNSISALNMQQIAAEITRSLNGAFPYNTSDLYFKPDLVTPWTVSSMESEIGHSLTAFPERFNDAGWWQAMQDALDRMLVVRKNPAMQLTARISSTRGTDPFPFTRTKQQAWDHRSDVPITSPIFGYGPVAGWFLYGDFSTFITHAVAECIRHIRVSTTALDDMSGTIVKGEMDYMFSMNGYSGSFSATLDGHTISFTGSGSGTMSINSFVAGINNDIDLVVTQSEPSMVPFTTTTIPGTQTYGAWIGLGATIYATPPVARCWLDMTSELTDQT